VNVAVGHDHRSEIELDAKLLERNSDGGKSGARLDDGKRKLAPGEEAGFLAVDGDELGSERICSRFLVCSASMTAPK